jgi:hypothetical protein
VDEEVHHHRGLTVLAAHPSAVLAAHPSAVLAAHPSARTTLES